MQFFELFVVLVVLLKFSCSPLQSSAAPPALWSFSSPFQLLQLSASCQISVRSSQFFSAPFRSQPAFSRLIRGPFVFSLAGCPRVAGVSGFFQQMCLEIPAIWTTTIRRMRLADCDLATMISNAISSTNSKCDFSAISVQFPNFKSNCSTTRCSTLKGSTRCSKRSNTRSTARSFNMKRSTTKSSTKKFEATLPADWFPAFQAILFKQNKILITRTFWLDSRDFCL